MRSSCRAGQPVTTRPSGTATIHARRRQYQWTRFRGDAAPLRDEPDASTAAADAGAVAGIVAVAVADTRGPVAAEPPRRGGGAGALDTAAAPTALALVPDDDRDAPPWPAI